MYTIEIRKEIKILKNTTPEKNTINKYKYSSIILRIEFQDCSL